MKKLLVLGLLAGLAFMPAWADDISNGSYSTTDGGNNAAPPNGWPAGMFPNQVEPSARANMGATKRWWERANPTLSTTGSAGAYVLTPTNTSYPTAYAQGEQYCAKANFASVGNDTLNINGLGAKALYYSLNGSLIRTQAGTILSGQQFCATYDGALNAGAGGFQIVSNVAPPVAQSRTTAGYVTLPGGMILQWGHDFQLHFTDTINLPIPFPNQFFSVTASVDGAASNYAGVVINNNSSFTVYKTSTNATFWFAIGY